MNMNKQSTSQQKLYSGMKKGLPMSFVMQQEKKTEFLDMNQFKAIPSGKVTV
jgi:hypothetical protein